MASHAASYCDAAAFVEHGCSESGRGISWSRFLQLVCRHCEAFGSCEPAKDLLDATSHIWTRLASETEAAQLLLSCQPGALAAAVIRNQFLGFGRWFEQGRHDALSESLREHLAPPEELAAKQDWSVQDTGGTAGTPRPWRLQPLLRPLIPFPLLASQHALYSRMDPVGTDSICNEQDGQRLQGRRFLPRADITKAHCSVRKSDAQLVRLCRARRQAHGDLFQDAWTAMESAHLRLGSPAAAAYDAALHTWRSLDGGASSSTCTIQNATCGNSEPELNGPSNLGRRSQLLARQQIFWRLRCPDPQPEPGSWWQQDGAEVTEEQLHTHNMEKYKHRVAEGGCQSERGLWGSNLLDSHKCVLMVVAELLRFRPGELLLEWGSGCGHMLSWAKAYFDVNGLGIEATAPAVGWASRFGLGRHCAADGRYLDWIPNGIFDNVFSYASLTHLEAQEQCLVVRQLLQKLRPGGRAFLGWNRAQRTSPWSWFDCLGYFPGSGSTDSQLADLEIMEEHVLFPEDKFLALDNFLWGFPSYAVLLTKTS